MIPCSQNMSFTPHKTEKMVDISAPWSYTTYTAYTAKIASILLCAMVIWQNNGVGDWSALDTGQGDPWDCYDYYYSFWITRRSKKGHFGVVFSGVAIFMIYVI